MDVNKWPRSFEFGEYLNGYGKNLSLKAIKLKVECDMTNIFYAKSVKYNILLDCGLTSPNNK